MYLIYKKVIMNLSPVKSKGGGDCLFDSVRIALASIGLVTTVTLLRKAVAVSLLDTHDKVANQYLLQWATIYADAVRNGEADLVHEYSYMAPLFPDVRTVVHFPLNRQQRVLVANQIMQSSFFGEEYSLRVLQQVLKMNIVVVDEEGEPCYQYEDKLRRKGLMFLQLIGIHYKPLQNNGKYIWQWSELPKEVQSILGHLKPHRPKILEKLHMVKRKRP